MSRSEKWPFNDHKPNRVWPFVVFKGDGSHLLFVGQVREGNSTANSGRSIDQNVLPRARPHPAKVWQRPCKSVWLCCPETGRLNLYMYDVVQCDSIVGQWSTDFDRPQLKALTVLNHMAVKTLSSHTIQMYTTCKSKWYHMTKHNGPGSRKIGQDARPWHISLPKSVYMYSIYLVQTTRSRYCPSLILQLWSTETLKAHTYYMYSQKKKHRQKRPCENHTLYAYRHVHTHELNGWLNMLCVCLRSAIESRAKRAPTLMTREPIVSEPWETISQLH